MSIHNLDTNRHGWNNGGLSAQMSAHTWSSRSMQLSTLVFPCAFLDTSPYTRVYEPVYMPADAHVCACTHAQAKHLEEAVPKMHEESLERRRLFELGLERVLKTSVHLTGAHAHTRAHTHTHTHTAHTHARTHRIDPDAQARAHAQRISHLQSHRCVRKSKRPSGAISSMSSTAP